MKFGKLILTALLALSLTGCAGLLAGDYTKTVATNPLTGEVLLNRFGIPIYNKTRTSRSVAIMRDNGTTSVSTKPADPCGELTTEVMAGLVQLTATGQAEFFRSRSDCQQTAAMGNIVAYATGQPTTEAGQVAREKQKAVAHSEKGLTDRTVGFVGGIVSATTAKVLGDAVEAGFNATRDVGIAAAENAGNIETTIHANQTVSTSSNDGEGGSGELGGSGTGGGNVEATQSGSTFVIGRGVNSSQASDSAFSAAGVRNAQNIESSATGALNSGSNIDQQPVIDENQGELSNQPENGNDNGL